MSRTCTVPRDLNELLERIKWSPERTVQERCSSDEHVNSMMRGWTACLDNQEWRHLGVYHFVLTAREIDTINANPMTSYIDLHE
jgi:hypothetical protein